MDTYMDEKNLAEGVEAYDQSSGRQVVVTQQPVEVAIATDDDGLRRGQWTDDEDTQLSAIIALHGVGNWNSLACLGGLKRSGKSCRLRWLNYLRPDLRRGNFSLEEQLLILQLHFRWGNRWSKIAQQLPGRTDNEIKNYWRTKVQKVAKQLNYNVNSPEFRDALLYTLMPRLVEQIQASAAATSESTIANTQLGPSIASEVPIYDQCGFGPTDDPYTNSDFSNSNYCFFDPSWAQTSPNWQLNGPGPGPGPADLHAASDQSSMDSPNSTPTNCAYNQTWEEQSYDQLLDILLSYEDSMLYSTCHCLN